MEENIGRRLENLGRFFLMGLYGGALEGLTPYLARSDVIAKLRETWKSFDPELAAKIRSRLMRVMFCHVGYSAIQLIVKFAAVDIPLGKWLDLVPMCLQKMHEVKPASDEFKSAFLCISELYMLLSDANVLKEHAKAIFDRALKVVLLPREEVLTFGFSFIRDHSISLSMRVTIDHLEELKLSPRDQSLLVGLVWNYSGSVDKNIDTDDLSSVPVLAMRCLAKFASIRSYYAEIQRYARDVVRAMLRELVSENYDMIFISLSFWRGIVSQEREKKFFLDRRTCMSLCKILLNLSARSAYLESITHITGRKAKNWKLTGTLLFDLLNISKDAFRMVDAFLSNDFETNASQLRCTSVSIVLLNVFISNIVGDVKSAAFAICASFFLRILGLILGEKDSSQLSSAVLWRFVSIMVCTVPRFVVLRFYTHVMPLLSFMMLPKRDSESLETSNERLGYACLITECLFGFLKDCVDGSTCLVIAKKCTGDFFKQFCKDLLRISGLRSERFVMNLPDAVAGVSSSPRSFLIYRRSCEALTFCLLVFSSTIGRSKSRSFLRQEVLPIVIRRLSSILREAECDISHIATHYRDFHSLCIIIARATYCMGARDEKIDAQIIPLFVRILKVGKAGFWNCAVFSGFSTMIANEYDFGKLHVATYNFEQYMDAVVPVLINVGLNSRDYEGYMTVVYYASKSITVLYHRCLERMLVYTDRIIPLLLYHLKTPGIQCKERLLTCLMKISLETLENGIFLAHVDDVMETLLLARVTDTSSFSDNEKFDDEEARKRFQRNLGSLTSCIISACRLYYIENVDILRLCSRDARMKPILLFIQHGWRSLATLFDGVHPKTCALIFGELLSQMIGVHGAKRFGGAIAAVSGNRAFVAEILKIFVTESHQSEKEHTLMSGRDSLAYLKWDKKSQRAKQKEVTKISHGKGTKLWSDGKKYDGSWNDSEEMHGNGVLSFKDGRKYVGEFRNGNRHGRGVLSWKGGRNYNGEWIDDKFEGQGTFVFPKKKKKGWTYSGSFKSGKKEGFGRMNWNNGRKYEGDWLSDMSDGHGVMTWKSGSKYDGNWRNGEKSGDGVYVSWNARDYLFSGFWENGKLVHGKFLSKDHLAIVFVPPADWRGWHSKVFVDIDRDCKSWVKELESRINDAVLIAISDRPISSPRAQVQALSTIIETISENPKREKSSVEVRTEVPPVRKEIVKEEVIDAERSKTTTLTLEDVKERVLTFAKRQSRSLDLFTKNLKLLEIPKKEIRKIRDPEDEDEFLTLGDGGYGIVYKCKWKRRNSETQDVAMKVLRLEMEPEALHREVQLVKMLTHPLVLTVYGYVAYTRKKKIGIVTELMKCSLHDVIYETNGNKSLSMKLELATMMITAVDFLHSKNVIHRDLKPPNFLISLDGKTVKIADFGLAKVKDGTMSITGHGPRGTARYMAKELYGLKPDYGRKSDIFALGICLYELFVGEKPFSAAANEHAITDLIKSGVSPEVPKSLPRPIIRLIESCIRTNASNRPSASKLLKTITVVKEKLLGRVAKKKKKTSLLMEKQRKNAFLNMEKMVTGPISMEVMIEPVILVETGQTYERVCIEEWLRSHKTDPMTGMKLRSKKLIPNHALRGMIEEWVRMNEGK